MILHTSALCHCCKNASSVICDVMLQTLQSFFFKISHEFFNSQENTTFPAAIFTKFPNGQQHFVYISYTEFHLNRTTNVGSRATNGSASLSKV